MLQEAERRVDERPEERPERWPIGKIDLIGATLAVVGGGVWVYAHFDDVGLALNEDLWFQADSGRAFADMVWHDSGHVRSSVHPLFVLVALPVVYLFRKVGHLDPMQAVRLFSSLVAGLWLATFYLLFRLLKLPRWEATTFSALAFVAAAPMFWFTCSETYPLGSLSILAVFVFLATTRDGAPSLLRYILVTLISLSMTITNGMVGAIATAVRLRWKRVIAVGAASLASLFALSLLQRAIFPGARLVGQRGGEEAAFLLDPKLGGPLHIIPAFFLHSVIAPAFGTSVGRVGEPILSFQMSRPGSSGLLGALAAGVWIVVLAVGLWGIVSSRIDGRFRAALGLALAGQLLLHLVYGDETFLYSLHFAPLLILVAALGAQTRARTLVLALVVPLVFLAAVNNYRVFKQARAFALQNRRISPSMATATDEARPRPIRVSPRCRRSPPPPARFLPTERARLARRESGR